MFYNKKKNSDRIISKKVNFLLQKEKNLNLFSENKLKNFKFKIQNHSTQMLKLIRYLRNKNYKISVYGASGKGQALMQFCKMDNKLIDYVFDKSKLKQKKFTPGTNIKILDPKLISRKKIDFLIILSWNIKDEIIKQENSFFKKGGKFIIPFPKPKIINKWKL